MKYLLSAILVICLVWNCKPQLPTEANYPKSETYFLGKWVNTKNEIYQNGKLVSGKTVPCQGKSYWKFGAEQNGVYLSKFIATGSACERMITTSPTKVALKSGQLQYFSGDVLIMNEIRILSNKKFVLIDKDIQITEKTFEKQ